MSTDAQDKIYGPRIRLHTVTGAGKNHKCTVCGKITGSGVGK